MFIESVILCMTAYSFDLTENKTQWSNICANIRSLITHARSNNIEPEAMLALTWHETRWRGNQTSHVGACGIAQVIPKYTEPRVTCRELQDDNVGLLYGSLALRTWLDHTNDNLRRAFCHYNSGVRCFTRSINYSRIVHRSYRRIKRIKRNYIDALDFNNFYIRFFAGFNFL